MTDRPSARATTTQTPGRFLLSARQAHFVADASRARGGPAEAPVAAELFLSSLAACSLAVIADTARSQGVGLPSVEVATSYEVDPADGTRFARVALDFRFAGVPSGQAEALVQVFKDVCPIYNTVARTTPVEITVTGE